MRSMIASPMVLDVLAAARWQLDSHRLAELCHQVGGLLVPVRLGQRGKAGDVGEHKRRRRWVPSRRVVYGPYER
jgi:hypothetical protein